MAPALAMSVKDDLSEVAQQGASLPAYRPGVRDTVVHALDRAVSRRGASLFADVAGERCTYQEIDRLSTRMVHAFQAWGVKAGDTVVTLYDTSMDVFLTWFAPNKLGAVWVPINVAYHG